MDEHALPLKFGNPAFAHNSKAEVLAVCLHGIGGSGARMADAAEIVRATFGRTADIFAPTLPYSRVRDATGLDRIVLDLAHDLDIIWANGRAYKRVIFIGHSLGAMLLRRLFLVGSLNPSDYHDEFLARDELSSQFARELGEDATARKDFPRPWAPKVERLILLTPWDKGWSISPRTSWIYSIALNALSLFSLVAGFVAAVLGNVSNFLNIFAEGRPWLANLNNGVSRRLEGGKYGRSMFDARQGSTFVVQSRLLWMAYRRWHNEEFRKVYNARSEIRDARDQRVQLSDPKALMDARGAPLTSNPLVIQFIASKDDFVSPQDQIDLDTEGAASWGPEGGKREKKYFVFELTDCDHADAARLLADRDRADLFAQTLTAEPGAMVAADKQSLLGRAARNPRDYFDDKPVVEDLGVTDVAFVIHGIRDDGAWTHRIAECIRREWAAQGNKGFLPSFTHSYGYFAMLPFILPWIRRAKVEWFMDQYVRVKAAYPAARLHYVGHSNGTYIGAYALETYPAARFHTIYFAGSVVNPRYDWALRERRKQVTRFHNARGGEDWVVALLPKSLEYCSDLGGAGFDGFDVDATHRFKGKPKWPGNDRFTQSDGFARHGHGGAIGEQHWPQIAKLIATGKTPDEDEELFATKQNVVYRTLSEFRFVTPVAFGAAALLLLWATSQFAPQLAHWSPPGWAWMGGLVAALTLAVLSRFKLEGDSAKSKWRDWALPALGLCAAAPLLALVGVTAFDTLGDLRAPWLGGFGAFLALQALSNRPKIGFRQLGPQKPATQPVKFVLFLLLVGLSSSMIACIAADFSRLALDYAADFGKVLALAGLALALVAGLAVIWFKARRWPKERPLSSEILKVGGAAMLFGLTIWYGMVDHLGDVFFAQATPGVRGGLAAATFFLLAAAIRFILIRI